jgi:hypothetical protein
MKETICLWHTNGGQHPNENHTVSLTTEELILLAAYWHVEAESIEVDAIFGVQCLSTSRWAAQLYAYERRNTLCDTLLDEASTAEAIARGEHTLRIRWQLSEAQWQTYRHGPRSDYDRLVASVQAEVERSMSGHTDASASEESQEPVGT